MESLRDYMQKWRIGIVSPIPQDLPNSYHATKEFGDTLLTVQGMDEIRIRDLFCIRTFALHYGIPNALYLIQECIAGGTNTFPKRLLETTDLPGIRKTDAADLEYVFLRWELAEEIPGPDSFIQPSEAKNIRSESVIQYSSICNTILESTRREYYDSLYSFFRQKILLMLSKCKLINIISKITHKNTNKLLDHILEEDVYPNVLASAPVT